MSKAAKKGEKFRLNVVTGDTDHDVELVQVDDDTQDAAGLNVDSLAEEHAEPSIVATKDGRMIIEMKPGKTCEICSVTFKSAKIFKKHKAECLEKISEFADTLEKEKNAAMIAQPGEEFFKYCNPNPDNPCYCCGEDVSTAHVGHIKCKLCPKSFKAYDYLERHLQAVHSDTSAFGCTQCNAKCPSEKVLNEHMMTHSVGKPFSCLKCGKDFTRKYHLERHLNHSSCGEIPKYLLPCEVCGKEFTRLDNLREHLRYHMGEAKRKRDYQCPHCEKAFYGSSLLNIHIRTHTGEKPFPCDLCTKTFPSTGALRKHRRSHTGERPYRCPECSATFAAKETLNRHRKTHTGEKPHECTMCNKKFIQATQLRAHMFHHTGENGFQCDHCEQTFNRKSRLDEHVRFVHLKETPLSCELCPKTFTRREDLHRHHDTHSDVKEYECTQCGKMFGSRQALKMHERTHAIEEPCICSICKHSFIRRDCLIRHIRTRHNGCPEAMSKVPPKKVQSEKQPPEGVLLEIEEVNETTEGDRLGTLPEEADEDEQMLEIDGEVYQITPLEDIQLVKINTRRKDIKKESQPVEEIPLVTPKVEPVPIEIKKVAAKPKRSLSVKPPAPEVGPPEVLPAVESVESVVFSEEVAPPVENEPQKEKKKRKRAAENASIVIPTKIKIEQQDQDDCMPIFLSDAVLKEKVNELLRMLIDEEVLEEFGWPRAPVDRVLSQVIKRCGHKPASVAETGDYTTRMRENTKILFALTMEDDSIRMLLNNHTIDEVIMSVLKSK